MSLWLTNQEIDALFPDTYTQITRVVYDKNVFLCENNRDKHILKVVAKNSFDPNKYDQLCLLSHKGIAKIYTYHIYEDFVIVIREYIPGNTLNHVIENEGVFSEDRIRFILSKLTHALDYLHTKEEVIIYRDLHPKNIIINLEGAPILIDIESSRIYKENSNHDTEVIGVIGFIAPEQYGFEQSSVLSDIYSLGIIGAYMLTGHYPTFQNNSIQLNDIKGSDALRVVLLKMVAFSKEKRPKSMRKVRTLLSKKTGNPFRHPFIVLLVVSIICLIGIYFITRSLNTTHEAVEDVLISSYTYEMFFDLANTAIYSSYEGNWQAANYGISGDSDSIDIVSVSYMLDQEYLSLKFTYDSTVEADTAAFLLVEGVSGVFAKYYDGTQSGTNDVVIKIDQVDLKSSIDNYPNDVLGIGYDLSVGTPYIVTIDLDAFYYLLEE